MDASIFISFASQDRKVASTLCKALESRGFKCWLSSRDILPGENFQVAIVRAIRKAKILLLVFTANSNGSEEMTKELALASQEKLIVVPLRIEDVAPSEAFTYEFATRQWIDFFADWEAAIDQLSERLAQALPAEAAAPIALKVDAEPVAAESRPTPRPLEPAIAPPEPEAVMESAPPPRPAPAPAAPGPTTGSAVAPAASALRAPKAKSRAGLYAAAAAAALVLVGLLAAPSLFGRKDATKDHLAAMATAETAASAQAGLSEARPLTDSDVAAATAARPALVSAQAAAVEEPVKVKPKKKPVAAPQSIEDIPY